MNDRNFSPMAESYTPTQNFKYAPTQREIDFAQLLAGGADPVDALLSASLITTEEAQTTPRPTLKKMATDLFNSPAVSERYDYYLILHRQSMDLTIHRMQQEQAAVAYADFAQAFDQTTGEIISNPHNIPRHLRAAIKEYRIDKDGNPTIKFHDKLKAMQQMGDMLGFFNEAHAAKAPQVHITLGGEATSSTSVTQPHTIDVTPPLEDCLK